MVHILVVHNALIDKFSYMDMFNLLMLISEKFTVGKFIIPEAVLSILVCRALYSL